MTFSKEFAAGSIWYWTLKKKSHNYNLSLMVLLQKGLYNDFPTVLRWRNHCCFSSAIPKENPQSNFSQREPLNLSRLVHYFSREKFIRARVNHFTGKKLQVLHWNTDVYYLDWAHIIFNQYYCLRVNRVQSAILKMVEIRILQRHLSL